MGRPKKRICYFRGSFLNAFEAQYLAPLQDDFALTVAYTRSHRFNVSDIPIPSIAVSCMDYANGIVPRRLFGKTVPNPLKFLGYHEVILGVNRLAADVDLFHINEQTFYSSWQIARQKHEYNYKLVTVQAEVNPFWYTHWPAVAKRAALVRRQTDLFIARSERAKTALLIEGVKAEKVCVIGHGVDLDRFHPGPRDTELCHSLRIDRDRFIILFVGHLIWTKGIFALAHAAKLLLADPEVKKLDPLFLLVGEGNERLQLEARLRLLGIAANFQLAGLQPYDRLPDLHRLADVFVLPSISTRGILEQFGIVLVESMASGKPVVATHCGAIDEVVGKAGLLVQPNDYYRLYRVLLMLCKDETRRAELGQKGLTRVRAEFGHATVSSKIARVYREALNS